MPKSKRRKQKRNSNRSSIDQHRQLGKELVPPFKQLMGENLQLASWMNNRLPEMLWASLIFASNGRKEAFREFSRILDFVAKHERKEQLKNLTISGIAELDTDLRVEIIRFIAANPRTSMALSTLLMFKSLPNREEWEANVSQVEPSLPLLMTAVGDTLFHQSPGATDCKWVWMSGMAAAGQIRVHKHLSDYVDDMTKYPNLEPGAPEGATVRASEEALAKMVYTESTWAENFWYEAWVNTECFQLAPFPQAGQVQLSTTRQRVNELIERLGDHWRQTHSTTAVDAKHDAMFGITFYSLRILTEMLTIGNVQRDSQSTRGKNDSRAKG